MKILKLINALIIMLNATFLFIHNNLSNEIIYDKPLVISKERFYQKTAINNDKNDIKPKNNWKELYLEKHSTSSMNKDIVKGMKFNGEDLAKFIYFNPNETIWDETDQNRYEMFAIVNGKHKNKPWNQIKDTIKEGDKIIFLKKSKKSRFQHWIYGNQANYFCKIKSTNFRFKGGRPWLLEMKIPIKGSDKPKKIWKPIYVPNTKLFCDKNEEKSTQWTMYIEKSDWKNINLKKEIKLGNMFFLNDKIIEAKGHIELIKNKKPFFKDGKIIIPYKAGKNIGIEEIRSYRDYGIDRNYPMTFYGYYGFDASGYIKEYIAYGFVKKAEFTNKKLLVNHFDSNLIVKNILKSNNFFGFNVYSSKFKEIIVKWGQKKQNNEIQPLTITLKDHNSTRNYHYNIWYESVIKENKIKEKQRQKEKKILDYERKKQAAREEKIQKEKEAFKQKFKIFEDKSKVNLNYKDSNFSMKKITKNEIKSKKLLFTWLMIGIVFIGIFVFWKDKK